MLRTRVIPCLLLDNRRLVKTVKFKDPAYIGDPVNALKIFNEIEVDELLFIDITATVQKRRPSFELLKEMSNECFMPFSYSGGVRSIDDIRSLLSIGFEKVSINTYAAENPKFISEAAEMFGSQAIVAAIDFKKESKDYFIYTHHGTKKIKEDPVSHAKKLVDLGAGEIFLNSIDRDGTWEGYDLDLINKVSNKVFVPVIACGGAGSVDDFRKAKEAGAHAVAAGSMVVYQRKGKGVLINFPNRGELNDLL